MNVSGSPLTSHQGRAGHPAGSSTRDGRHGAPADRDDPSASFLALVDEAFRRLLDEPDAHLHVTGFAEGNVAFMLTRDGLEVRRRAEVYGSEN